MNWGKGLIITLIAFVIFITALGIKMFTQNNDEYDHDYYEKGLSFDADYNREKQVVKDDAKPLISFTKDSLTVKFKAIAKGNIRLVRPSDHDMDRYLNFDTKTTSVLAMHSPFHGQWQMIIAWQSDGKSYLYQQAVFIK